MSKPTKKAVYRRIRNRAVYNRALARRGSLTVWVDEAVVAAWRAGGGSVRGRRWRCGAGR